MVLQFPPGHPEVLQSPPPLPLPRLPVGLPVILQFPPGLPEVLQFPPGLPAVLQFPLVLSTTSQGADNYCG